MSERVIDTLVTEFGFRTNTGALKGLETRVQRLQQGLNRASRAFTVVGGALTAGLLGTGRGILDTDKAMKTLEARTGATAEQMAAFKEQAYDVGSQLPLNTADIIRAQTAFVQLGNSIDEALAATPGIAMAAVAAEGVEIEDAARYASIALNAFEEDAGQATSVLDAMLATETTTAANTRSLGEAFRFSAQSAADAGLDYQTYIATLGVLAGSGRSAEESSSGLNVMFTKMAAAMEDIGRGGPLVEEAFGAMGLELDTVIDLMAQGPEGFIRLIEQMGEAQEKFGKTATTAGLRALVGESYASAFSYLIANADQLREAQERAYNSMGEGARQSEIQMEGLSGSWESLKAQMDTAINLLGDNGVAGALENAARSLADLIDRFNQADDGVKKFVAGTLLAGPVLLGIGGILKAVSVLLGGLVPLITVVGAVIGSSIALPLVLIAGALLAVWAAVTYWDEIKAFLERTGDDIASNWAEDTAQMSNEWDAFVAQFTTDEGWTAPIRAGWANFVAGWHSDLAEIRQEWSAFTDWFSQSWLGRYLSDTGSDIAAQWNEDIGQIGSEFRLFSERFQPQTPNAAGGSAFSSSASVTVEKIEIYTPDGDPTTIAEGLRDPLTEQLHNVAEDFSSVVVR